MKLVLQFGALGLAQASAGDEACAAVVEGSHGSRDAMLTTCAVKRATSGVNFFGLPDATADCMQFANLYKMASHYNHAIKSDEFCSMVASYHKEDAQAQDPMLSDHNTCVASVASMLDGTQVRTALLKQCESMHNKASSGSDNVRKTCQEYVDAIDSAPKSGVLDSSRLCDHLVPGDHKHQAEAAADAGDDAPLVPAAALAPPSSSADAPLIPAGAAVQMTRASTKAAPQAQKPTAAPAAGDEVDMLQVCEDSVEAMKGATDTGDSYKSKAFDTCSSTMGDSLPMVTANAPGMQQQVVEGCHYFASQLATANTQGAVDGISFCQTLTGRPASHPAKLSLAHSPQPHASGKVQWRMAKPHQPLVAAEETQSVQRDEASVKEDEARSQASAEAEKRASEAAVQARRQAEQAEAKAAAEAKAKAAAEAEVAALKERAQRAEREAAAAKAQAKKEAAAAEEKAKAQVAEAKARAEAEAKAERAKAAKEAEAARAKAAAEAKAEKAKAKAEAEAEVAKAKAEAAVERKKAQEDAACEKAEAEAEAKKLKAEAEQEKHDAEKQAEKAKEESVEQMREEAKEEAKGYFDYIKKSKPQVSLVTKKATPMLAKRQAQPVAAVVTATHTAPAAPVVTTVTTTTAAPVATTHAAVATTTTAAPVATTHAAVATEAPVAATTVAAGPPAKGSLVAMAPPQVEAVLKSPAHALSEAENKEEDFLNNFLDSYGGEGAPKPNSTATDQRAKQLFGNLNDAPKQVKKTGSDVDNMISDFLTSYK
mmetsp:Transcript_56760/g.124453  ORF Transcript_56760/g.124453 Transcript_56760/m.124453 type:complete len:768 (-) Transcript_56760:36-2339(-)